MCVLISPWTLFARAPVVPCLVQRQSQRFATTAVPFVRGKIIVVGLSTINGLVHPSGETVIHAPGNDMRLLYKLNDIVFISPSVV